MDVKIYNPIVKINISVFLINMLNDINFCQNYFTRQCDLSRIFE